MRYFGKCLSATLYPKLLATILPSVDSTQNLSEAGFSASAPRLNLQSGMERATERWKLYIVHAFTLSRLLLTPFVVWAIARDRPLMAGWLCGIAGATDAFDGGLARRFHATTRAGQYLDPISDKILLSAVYLALAWTQSVPWALVILIFSRDLALLVASAIAMRFSTYSNYTPTIWGKISTFVQIVTAVVVLAANAFGSIGLHVGLHDPLRDLARIMIVTTGITTVWSAVNYTWRGIAYFRRR